MGLLGEIPFGPILSGQYWIIFCGTASNQNRNMALPEFQARPYFIGPVKNYAQKSLQTPAE